MAYDAAGILTFDGVFRYGYDAWNRIVRVTKAYYDTNDSQIHNGSDVAAMQYDGLGRRIVEKEKGS